MGSRKKVGQFTMTTTSDSKSFHLEIVSPERKVFSGDVEFGVFPGTEGEMGILPRHAPLLSQLTAGEMKIVQNGVPSYFALSGGFLEVKDNKVTIAAETCEAASEIDVERANKAQKAAQTALQENKNKEEILLAKHKEKRAVARLKVAVKATLQGK
jgi:F-type H+-transporting ATPase subunit epsilon